MLRVHYFGIAAGTFATALQADTLVFTFMPTFFIQIVD
jgi:hypothetical protein